MAVRVAEDAGRENRTFAVGNREHRGRPLADVLVAAVSKAEGPSTVTTRTDNRGQAELLLDGRGPWLVKAVHMVRATDPADDADWESFWASLTFDTGASGAPASTSP